MSAALAAGQFRAGLLAAAMGGSEALDAMALFGFGATAKPKQDIEGLKARYPHWFTDEPTTAHAGLSEPALPALA